MFRQFGAQELIIILLIVVLLFGAKKLPETARGLGRSLRIFKAETKGLNDDDATPEADAPAPPQPQLSAERSTEPVAPAAPAADPTVAPSTSSADERS